jgi:putative membrane protein
MTMMWGGGWWVVGALVMVVCIFMMGRMMMGHGGSGHGGHGDIEDRGNRSAHDILVERFARGEISKEEFEQRKKVLERSSDQVHTAT